ncbi:MAG: hypothetical protein ACK4FV_04350 [Candidatus Nitrosocaldus sp.]
MIIGVGGAGARIAKMMMDVSALDTMLISSNANDLSMMERVEDDKSRSNDYACILDTSCIAKRSPRIKKVLLNTGVLNPSPYTIRGSLLAYERSICNELIGYNTFIMVANLAGRNGVAIAPLLADMIKANNSNVRLITFAIMPFGFENDRLFRAGVALKKLSEMSDCTIVVDNDSFLTNNPDLSIERCYKIVNSMILAVFKIMTMNGEVKGLNMLSAGRDDDSINVIVRDALRMLYSNTKPDKVKSALLYLVDRSTEGISIGLIDSLSKCMRSILGDHKDHVMVKVSIMRGGGYGKGKDDGENDVHMERVSSSNDRVVTGGMIGIGAHDNNAYSAILLAEVTGIHKFDSYDPLSILPRECMLDWECSEAEIRLESLTALPNLE